MADEHIVEPRLKRQVGGTQAISRAARLLRMIARSGPMGARLTQLTRLADLPHPTIRRILKCLMDEGLVIQDATNRHYRLGPLNFELGLATMREANSERAYHALLEDLARLTGDTMYLMARSGAELVCLDRVEGHFPIRAHLFNVGGRRPLGFGAAGLALLAALEDTAVNRIIETNMHEIEVHRRITIESIREGVGRTRRRGYAVTSDIYTMGIGSIGIALPSEKGPPSYALNLSTVGAERFAPERISKLYELMRERIGSLSSQRGLLGDEIDWDVQWHQSG